MRDWFGRVAMRLQDYGSITNVLMQHCPGYVILAWGARNVLFVVVVRFPVLSVGTIPRNSAGRDVLSYIRRHSPLIINHILVLLGFSLLIREKHLTR